MHCVHVYMHMYTGSNENMNECNEYLSYFTHAISFTDQLSVGYV